jgi:hypothetical protein
MRASGIPEVLRHYLETGCYLGGSPDGDPAALDTFVLGGHVLAGDVLGLARCWRDLAPVLRRQPHESLCFAERVLAAVEGLTTHSERFAAVGAIARNLQCPEHDRSV